MIALSLTTSGFGSITAISDADTELLQTVPGLELAETAQGVKAAAAAYLAEHGEVDIEALIAAEEAEAVQQEAEQESGEVPAAPAVSGEDETDQRAE